MMSASHSASREICRRADPAASEGGCYSFGTEVADIGLAPQDGSRLCRIHVETDDWEPRFFEDEGEGEAHIPETQDTNDGRPRADLLLEDRERIGLTFWSNAHA
jgi:hypothetical protein